MAALSYDTQDVSMDDYLPAGDYPVQIVETDVKPTKAGTGQILVLTMEVMEGDAKGRRHWENLNVVNPNATAQNIARRTQKQIEAAIGTGPVQSSEQLHNKPFIVTFSVKDEGEYGMKNQIKKVRAYTNPGPASAANGAPAPAATPSAAGGADHPW